MKVDDSMLRKIILSKIENKQKMVDLKTIKYLTKSISVRDCAK